MDIVWGAGRLLAAGSVEIDDIAALGPKADPGIHFPPNPLVRIAAIDVGAGVGLDSGSLEWILFGWRGDSWLPAQSKSMILPP